MMVTKLHDIISKYIAGDDNRKQLTSEIVKEIVQSGIWCGWCGKDLEIICDDCKKVLAKCPYEVLEKNKDKLKEFAMRTKVAPISGYEALYDVEVPINDVAKEQMLNAIEVFKNMIPKEYNALHSDAQKVSYRFDEHYRKLNSEQKPLDADIAEHINNHFEELL